MRAARKVNYFSVVGVGRSGTTLLMTMLASHPGITMPPETQFVMRHLMRRPDAGLEEMRIRLSADTNFARLGFDVDELVAPFTQGAIGFAPARLYRRIMELWSERSGIDIVGDKAPKNIEFLPVVRRLYPDAKIVHIVRDPREVFLSRTKAGWSAGRWDILQTLAYRVQREQGARLGPQLFGKQYREVRYEDLLREPSRELTRVCELLGVEYDNRMLDRAATAASLVFDEEIAWKREVLGPLLRGNTEKWRGELSAELIAFVEDCCASSFGNGGYEPAIQGRVGRGGVSGRLTRARMAVLGTLYQGMLTYRIRRVLAAMDRQGL